MDKSSERDPEQALRGLTKKDAVKHPLTFYDIIAD